MIRLKFDSKTQHPTLQQLIDKGCKKLLIQYPHGLGDVLMFLPYFHEFRTKNRNCQIDIKLNPVLSDMATDINPDSYYDYIVWIPAHFNEVQPAFKGLTKPECNCNLDLGMPYDPLLQYTTSLNACTGLVGINLYNSYNTGGADNINCSQKVGKLLWDSLQEESFICVQLFVPKNIQALARHRDSPQFIDWSMRTKGLGIDKLVALMRSLKGVASVATGTFHLGMTMYPQRCLFLKNKFDVSCFTKKFNVLQLDVNNPDQGIVREWIRRMKDDNPSQR